VLAIDTTPVSENCLKRDAVKSLAAGRYPKNELVAVRRHLAECARCRAAVVAAASGLRGPGDTVLLKRSEAGTVPTWLKLGVFAVSVLVAGGAWRYGGALKSTDSGRPRGVQVQAPLEAASVSTHREPVMPAGAPAPVSETNRRPEATATPSVDPASSEVTESLQSPRVRPIMGVAYDARVATDRAADPSGLGQPIVDLAPPSVKPLVEAVPPAAEETRQPAKAQQGPARPTQFRSANAPRPINAPRSPRKDEVDFGID